MGKANRRAKAKARARDRRLIAIENKACETGRESAARLLGLLRGFVEGFCVLSKKAENVSENSTTTDSEAMKRAKLEECRECWCYCCQNADNCPQLRTNPCIVRLYCKNGERATPLCLETNGAPQCPHYELKE